MGRAMIPNDIELKFKGKNHVGWPRTRWLSQILEYAKKRGKGRQEIEKERLWEETRSWTLVSFDLCETEAMLEEENKWWPLHRLRSTC
jgi:hypothetical protein